MTSRPPAIRLGEEAVAPESARCALRFERRMVPDIVRSFRNRQVRENRGWWGTGHADPIRASQCGGTRNGQHFGRVLRPRRRTTELCLPVVVVLLEVLDQAGS